MLTDEDVRIMTDNTGGQTATSNSGKRGVKITEILNEDVGITSSTNKMYSPNGSIARVKLNTILNEDVGVSFRNLSQDNSGTRGVKLNHLLNEANDCFLDERGGRKGYASNFGLSNHGYKLDFLFKEKYQGQFELDFENKILYRTVKSFTGYPSSIIDIKYSIPTSLKEKKHPTTKPIEVLEYLIERYTEEGDNVLDMTMRQWKHGRCL